MSIQVSPVYACSILFVVVSIVRILGHHSAWRKAHPGERSVTKALVVRVVTKAVLGAAYGMLLVTAIAAVLVAGYHREVDRPERVEYAGLGTAILMVAAYLVVVPIASWVGLRMLNIRPA